MHDLCRSCDLSPSPITPMEFYLSSARDPEEFGMMLDAFTRAMFGTGGSWRLERDEAAKHDGETGGQGDGETRAETREPRAGHPPIHR